MAVMSLKTILNGGHRGPVGIGGCACDKTNIINHVHTHLVGLGGVGWVVSLTPPLYFVG